MNQDNSKAPSLAELIKAREFNWASPEITDGRFPTPDRLWTDYRVFNFGRDVSSDEAVLLIRTCRYEPANSHELLLWEGWNGGVAVAALGSITKDDMVLCLDCHRRHLILCWWNVVDWSAHYYFFLGVRKPSGS